MGGNALKVAAVDRFDKKKFDLVSSHLTSILHSLGVYMFVILGSYEDKEDFGDVDVIIFDPVNVDRIKFIKENFNPVEIHRNSDVISFDFMGVQVDFIYEKSFETLVTHVWYAQYSDLGNLMGRIAHKMGLKFGHDGLWMIVRDGTHVIGEILVTRNIDATLELLDYDVDRYHAGFKNLTQIFDFVMSSKFYSYDIFDLDNRNYRARVRDRKRNTYTEFLKYAESRRKPDVEYKWNPDKTHYLPMIFRAFPAAKERYDVIQYRNHMRKEVALKFNGELVSKMTGLVGKQLGAFIKTYRDQFSLDDQYHMSPSTIVAEIENLFRKFSYDE